MLGKVDTLSNLSPAQRDLLARWLPGCQVVRDHSWGLVETQVLEVVSGGERYIVKAGGPRDGHIARELEAHETWLGPWTTVGRAPRLVHGDGGAKLLLTQYLPGRLVLDSPAQQDPDTFVQAGRLLAALHGQAAVVDHDYEATLNARAIAWLDGPHRIDAPSEARLRAEIASWPTPPARLVPTHGDWQPRNWLVHEGVVSVIDFGRAALRPAMSDLVRLSNQDFAHHPALEAAFLEGYGADPREPRAWRREKVREAIGTSCWAFLHGDDGFEQQGHRMVADVLRA